MKEVKICPDCLAEYFPQIETCADCGSALMLPEEVKKMKEEITLSADQALKSPVVIREGSLKWVNELFDVLRNSSIPCVVSTDDGCKKSCCGDTYRLLVSADDSVKANERIERYCGEIYPEIKASQEMISQGQCPACGCTVGSDRTECPDCGLVLLIIES